MTTRTTDTQAQFQVTISTSDAEALRALLKDAGFLVEETGEFVMTDDGLHGETVLRVHAPQRARDAADEERALPLLL